MLEANLDRKIDVAYALMQRLDSGEPVSAVLPQVKTLAGLQSDDVMEFLVDLLMYGIDEIPDVKPPFTKQHQGQATKLFVDLFHVQDIRGETVNSALEKRWTEVKKDHVLNVNVFGLEQSQEPSEPFLGAPEEVMNEILRTRLLHQQIQQCLSKTRSYVYGYASTVWQKSLKERDNVALLGPDYRLVIDAVGALNSEVADELTAALDNLGSENPANWALSALGCRNVLLKLGTILWRAKGDQHQSALLKKPLTLTGDAEKNKLSAYIDVHWRTASGENQQKLEEAHNLVQPIYDIGSRGKIGNKFRRSEAQKLVVDTFRLVDMLQDATDLIAYDGQPITGG